MNRRVFMASLAALVSSRLFGGSAEAKPGTLTDAADWGSNRWSFPMPNGVININTQHRGAWRVNKDYRRNSGVKVTGPIRLEFDRNPREWRFDSRLID